MSRTQTWESEHIARVRQIKRESAARRRAASLELSRAIGRFKSRLWNLRHPEQHRANVKAFKAAKRAADPQAFKLKRRAEALLRRARKRAATVGLPVDYQRICARDRMVCHLCRRKVREGDLEFDHVIPLARGGLHAEENIAVSHNTCNRRKSARVMTLF